MQFVGTADSGHAVVMDAPPSVGGSNTGSKPSELLLMAFGGCSGMDVVSILKKMRIELNDFNVRVEGDLTEEHPRQFSKMNVIYEFKGKDLPIDKLQKAINLSEERYCGVSALYRKAITITSEIKILE